MINALNIGMISIILMIVAFVVGYMVYMTEKGAYYLATFIVVVILFMFLIETFGAEYGLYLKDFNVFDQSFDFNELVNKIIRIFKCFKLGS